MDVPEGWYIDPTGAIQQRYRYWDGRQWTRATAVAAAPRQDWAQRHPAWTTLIVFWLACMVWSWTWLAPTVAAIAGLTWIVRWDRARRARLTADAEEQNELALEGDPRGIYGNFPPVEAA